MQKAFISLLIFILYEQENCFLYMFVPGNIKEAMSYCVTVYFHPYTSRKNTVFLFQICKPVNKSNWHLSPVQTPFYLCINSPRSSIPSFDIPVAKHFCSRQYWHLFLVTLLITQFLSLWQVYCIFFWTLLLKKP